MSSENSEYLDITAEVDSRAITGILCDTTHTPVSKICRINRRLCVDLALDPAYYTIGKALHICLQASNELVDYLIAELCAEKAVKIKPLDEIGRLRLPHTSFQLTAISSIEGIDYSFMVNSTVFLYRYGVHGPFIDGFFGIFESAPYIINSCSSRVCMEQKSTHSRICTHVVILPN